METATFDFCGDKLKVTWTGSVWVSPSNGQQHSRIGGAVRQECEAYLRAGGDDPAELGAAIEAAIDDVKGGA